MMWPGVPQQVCVTTSPVVFLSWLFRWSREEMELLSEEGRLGTQNKHTLSIIILVFCAHTLCQVVQVQLPGRAAQYSFGQAGFLQQLRV